MQDPKKLKTPGPLGQVWPPLGRMMGAALLLFVAFNLLLSTRLFGEYRIALPNQWLNNHIVAQDYSLRKTAPLLVITGSSLSMRIPTLDSRAFNLALGGLSSQTGLEIIERSGQVPRFVLVEVNTLEREIQKDLVAATFNPVQLGLRRLFRSQRSEHRPGNYVMFFAAQPVLLLQSLGRQFSVRSGTDGTARALNEAPRSSAPDRQPEAGRTHRDRDRKSGAEPDAAWLAARDAYNLYGMRDSLAIARAYAQRFRRRGCTVIYFEMPVHSSISGRPAYSAILDLARRTLKDDILLAPFDSTAYTYTDGGLLGSSWPGNH